MGYNHVAGAAGQTLVPDLAVRVPAPTNGGKTYTFVLKRGIHFGPPVNRLIASTDVRYAIERLARKRSQSLWALGYGDIKGFGAYRSGKARSIDGISTPNARTIAITLVRPAGDFLHRMALPPTAPIPPEVGRCFESRRLKYGPHMISSGPYMLEGAGAMSISSCAALRPMRGLSRTHLILVRNPRYDPRTDSTAARESNPDRFVFVADPEHSVQSSQAAEAARRLAAGELEDAFQPSFWPFVIRKYAADAAKRGRLRLNPWGESLWIALNLTQPPFDDVHVRRALAWVIDRAALREAYGGRLAGPIAQHVIPDELLDDQLKGFAPFKSRGDHGDLARAKAEMAKSKYAVRNGVCVAKACKSVRFGSVGPYAPSQRIKPVVKDDARRIGIVFINRRRPYDVPSSNNPVLVNVQWLTPWPDPVSFFEPNFAGRSIRPKDNLNYSLLGLTPKQAARLHVGGAVRRVPSIDSGLARCNSFTGIRRTSCYAALDRHLTRLVPAIPFLWRNAITILGPQVVKWEFDQSTGTTAFAHVAVKR